MYNGNRYVINENHKYINKDYNTKKIVLNNINDLINIPIQQLRTAQLKNFCGNLFDQLYEEAMVIEHNQQMKIPKKIIPQDIKHKRPGEKNTKKDLIKPIYYKIAKKDKNKIKEIPIKNDNIKGKSITSGKKVIKIIKRKIRPKRSVDETDLNSNLNAKMSPILNGSDLLSKSNKYNTEINRIKNIEPFPLYKVININMNKNELIKKIIFSIKYNTQFGEEVGILGSIPILGNWNQNQIFYLCWNNGNIWKGEILIETEPPLDFEFKFVISYNRNVKKWESGENNKVHFSELINEIKYKKNGFFNKYEYSYDSLNGELYLKCKWE